MIRKCAKCALRARMAQAGHRRVDGGVDSASGAGGVPSVPCVREIESISWPPPPINPHFPSVFICLHAHKAQAAQGGADGGAAKTTRPQSRSVILRITDVRCAPAGGYFLWWPL